VVAPLQFQRSVAASEVRFAKSVARRPLKAMVIGPVSLSLQLSDHVYGDAEAMVLDIATALNSEMRALEAAGADVLQIDEPSWHFNVELAQRVGQRAISRMVEGITAPIIVHVCYGYAIVYKEKSGSRDYPVVLELLAECPIAGISLEYAQPGHEPDILRCCGDKHVVLGLLDLGLQAVEAAADIAQRIRAALEVVPAERLHPCSDCGMWFLPRELAYAKISALVAATQIVRREIGLASRSPVL
jgi:5-methyltetrahydropteroyltriglutamate--homocysteine methyltransferase